MARSLFTIRTVAAFGAALLLCPPPGLSAQKEPGSSSRLRDKRQELTKVRRELDRERKQAKLVARKEQSLFEELDQIDRQLRQRGQELKELQVKLRTSTQRLHAIQREIKLTQTQLDQIKGLFRRRVRAIYKQGRHGYVQALLSSEDLSGAGRRIRYLAAIANQDRRMVASYTAGLET
ncbi:MAG TPA: hypothetical protein VJM10_00160, partial [Candidatus Methylomirabilis sp.]|nr:hypothetical protein [Candidatus Methylomirabilis sp.]